LTSDKRWNKSYLFQYTRSGYYSIWKSINGKDTALQSWAKSPKIKTGYKWNTLKVVANGNRLKFYINGHLVWSGTDTSLSTGRAGISMYSPSSSSGEKVLG